MAKKKGKRSKKNGGESNQVTEESVRFNLVERASQLKCEIGKEHQDSRQYNEQRDQFVSYRALEKAKLQEILDGARSRSIIIHELDVEHEKNVIEHKNKVKFILTELRDEITEEKLKSEATLEAVRTSNGLRWSDAAVDRRRLIAEVKEGELSRDAALRGLRDGQDTDVDELRSKYLLRSQRIARHYAERIREIRTTGEGEIEGAVSALEEKKRTQTEDMIRRHKEHSEQFREYYQGVISKYLELVKSLQKDLTEAKKRETRSAKLAGAVSEENENITRPFAEAQDLYLSISFQLEGHDKERAELTHAKSLLRKMERRLESLEWEYEVSLQKSEDVTFDRDRLNAGLSSHVYDTRRKKDFQRSLLSEAGESSEPNGDGDTTPMTQFDEKENQ